MRIRVCLIMVNYRVIYNLGNTVSIKLNIMIKHTPAFYRALPKVYIKIAYHIDVSPISIHVIINYLVTRHIQ